MASSSSMPPVSPTPQPNTGEWSGVPTAASTASTEAVVGAPVAPSSALGEATLVAPSSISGETNDPKEGFVFPLVDPWFEISSLFPCKSLDFSFSLEDWDWMVTGSEVTVDRAWVPCLDEISNLLIQKGDVQPVPINFEFPCVASKDWSYWVDLEILDSGFWDNLRKVGIHWSIIISRSCNMFRESELLREVLRRWYPSTHTFFFAWGELTVTLEDIANHWMLPILGEYSFSNIELSVAEEEVAAALRRHSSTKLSSWPTLFVHCEDIPIRRTAFILYWLCKCLFGNFPYYVKHSFHPFRCEKYPPVIAFPSPLCSWVTYTRNWICFIIAKLKGIPVIFFLLALTLLCCRLSFGSILLVTFLFQRIK